MGECCTRIEHVTPVSGGGKSTPTPTPIAPAAAVPGGDRGSCGSAAADATGPKLLLLLLLRLATLGAAPPWPWL